MESLTSDTDVFDRLRNWAPDELLSFLDQVVLILPGEVRYRLKQVVDSLPGEGDHLQKVLELVRSQWKGIRSEEWVKIAVVGPAQTGKTALVEALRREQELSSKPVLSVVELAGLEEFLGYERGNERLEELHEAALIVLVLDARLEVSDSTRRMYEGLKEVGKPVLVVLNRIDGVDSPSRALSLARRQLGAVVLAASGAETKRLGPLLKAAVDLCPAALPTLTEAFPEFRRGICAGIVTQASFAAAIAGAVPIPVSDFLPITAIQTGMLLKVARAFGFPLDRRRAREILPLLAAGLAVREGSHELRVRFPQYRRLISVSVAGIWTLLLGHTAIGYFDRYRLLLAEERSEREMRLPAVGESE